MPLLNRNNLKRPFSASHYIQTSEGVMLPDELTSRAQWIVSRNLCLFKTFPLDSLPSKNRAQALEVIIRRWAPFDMVGFHVVWTQQYACVWAWDEFRVQSSVEEVGVQIVSVLPESVYYAPMEEDGSRWIAAKDGGFIFQIWLNRLLVNEKWFAAKPSSTRFDLFIRSLEVPNDIELSWDDLRDLCHLAKDSGEKSLTDKPWGAKNQNLTIIQNLPWEQSVVLACAFVVVLCYAWMASAILASSMSLSAVNSRVAEMAQSAEPVLTARTEAEQASENANRLLDLIDYPSQINMLADVAKVMKSFELILKDWNFQGARIEVTTEGDVNTLNVVKKFEALTWSQSVSVSSLRRQGQNKFILDIKVAD
ncbi:hypothetical protein [Alteromonas gracilis]|uniref:hypothetical protein n=1 Tax=Alteromonas gracilis TaxID=1479524 RepID=UPI002FDFA185